MAPYAGTRGESGARTAAGISKFTPSNISNATTFCGMVALLSPFAAESSAVTMRNTLSNVERRSSTRAAPPPPMMPSIQVPVHVANKGVVSTFLKICGLFFYILEI